MLKWVYYIIGLRRKNGFQFIPQFRPFIIFSNFLNVFSVIQNKFFYDSRRIQRILVFIYEFFFTCHANISENRKINLATNFLYIFRLFLNSLFSILIKNNISKIFHFLNEKKFFFNITSYILLFNPTLPRNSRASEIVRTSVHIADVKLTRSYLLFCFLQN